MAELRKRNQYVQIVKASLPKRQRPKRVPGARPLTDVEVQAIAVVRTETPAEVDQRLRQEAAAEERRAGRKKPPRRLPQRLSQRQLDEARQMIEAGPAIEVGSDVFAAPIGTRRLRGRR